MTEKVTFLCWFSGNVFPKISKEKSSYVWNYKDMVCVRESLESHIELLEQGLRPVLG